MPNCTEEIRTNKDGLPERSPQKKSHASRRKFYDIHERQRKQLRTMAHVTLQRIAAIFAIGADIPGQLPAERNA